MQEESKQFLVDRTSLSTVLLKLKLWAKFLEFMVGKKVVKEKTTGELWYFRQDVHNFLQKHYTGTAAFFD